MVRNKLLMAMMIDDGDDGCNEHEEKRRRQMILATLSALVVAPNPVHSFDIKTLSKRSYDDNNVLETINWKQWHCLEEALILLDLESLLIWITVCSPILVCQSC